MNAPSQGASLLRSPGRPGQPQAGQAGLLQLRRVESSSSDSSTSTQINTYNPALKSQQSGQQGTRRSGEESDRPTDAHGATTGLQHQSRHAPGRTQVLDNTQSNRPPLEKLSQTQQHNQGLRHAQGFFEPSLRITSASSQHQPSNLTASQIAAQAAMQHQSSQQHLRKRSQTVPSPTHPGEGFPGGQQKSPLLASNSSTVISGHDSEGTRGLQNQNGSLGGPATAAATAASTAYPRSALASSPAPPSEYVSLGLEKELKQKPERSKMKLFSKPKNIGISKDKDAERKDRGLPSPNKMGIYGPSPLPRAINAPSSSMGDSSSSAGQSGFYKIPNSSSTTLGLVNDGTTASEKHKHHFLSRQKHKLKDKDEHHHLPLSSAASNSRPLDPNAPQSLYSFTPSSPSPAASSFTKSVSGFDLRHGARALRDRKREEKASAAASAGGASVTGLGLREEDFSATGNEWPGSLNLAGGSNSNFPGHPNAGSISVHGGTSFGQSDSLGNITLQGIGLPGMTPDDAWPFLKAKLLTVFEGEDLRLPIEDLNRLVIVHVQRCVQLRAPNIIMDDLQDLLHTGFASLDQHLRCQPEERLVPRLVDMWLAVFGTILPYMQAVFLPLDHEFTGKGAILGPRDAQEFWGALPDGDSDTPLGENLDVRRIVLIAFRDVVILPRYDTLRAVFSRLSLDSLNEYSELLNSNSNLEPGGTTAMTGSLDPGLASYNSQGSTLLNDSGASVSSRSRATSNTSSAFGTSPSAAAPLVSAPARLISAPLTSVPQPWRQASASAGRSDSSRVTETVGRMLQCVSVLASLQSADDAQNKMEGLAKTLKHNWLGRGRTGRNRKGFVGTKMSGPRGRDGSPTPTPSTIQGTRRESML